jgi:hypothetical protein
MRASNTPDHLLVDCLTTIGQTKEKAGKRTVLQGELAIPLHWLGQSIEGTDKKASKGKIRISLIIVNHENHGMHGEIAERLSRKSKGT